VPSDFGLILPNMRMIDDGPTRLPARGDCIEWCWTVRSESGAEETVLFAVPGTAGCSALDCLPRRVRQAIESMGRSEIERILDVAEMPSLIEASTGWVTIHYRDGTRSQVW
jgi:hypothetical protein